MIAEIDRAPGGLSKDVTAVVAELGVVLGVVGGLLAAGTNYAWQQRGRTVGVGQAKVRPLAEFALVDRKGGVVQQVRFYDVIAIEAPVPDMTELLEGLGQRSGDRSDERVAVEVLFTEHSGHAQFVIDDMITFDRVNALPGCRRTLAVVARRGCVYDGRVLLGQGQLG